MLNLFVRTSSLAGTEPYCEVITLALGLSSRKRARSCVRSSSLTQSVLLTSSMSANSTCSTSISDTTLLSSRSASSPTSAKSFASMTSVTNRGASTTVVMVSRYETLLSPSDMSPSANRAATGIGRAMPVPSMMSRSYACLLASVVIVALRSSLREQHMQPLDSSTMEDSCTAAPFNSFSSMLMSATSFTITAMRKPSWLASTRLSVVVFPAPRNPASSITGRRASGGLPQGCRDSCTWPIASAAEAHTASLCLGIRLAWRLGVVKPQVHGSLVCAGWQGVGTPSLLALRTAGELRHSPPTGSKRFSAALAITLAHAALV
mmetsp:Transcript_29301/g.82653  ORF Transcript_29301/g.82653 Transcript_29301/m.82653 type:complete len:320 (-) Transcript_29301:86-1045(-)